MKSNSETIFKVALILIYSISMFLIGLCFGVALFISL